MRRIDAATLAPYLVATVGAVIAAVWLEPLWGLTAFAMLALVLDWAVERRKLGSRRLAVTHRVHIGLLLAMVAAPMVFAAAHGHSSWLKRAVLYSAFSAIGFWGRGMARALEDE